MNDIQTLANIAGMTAELIESGKLVRVIRCKDCKHGSLYCTEDVCGETLIECNRPDIGDAIEIHKWNWFCADGKKRQEDA